MKPREIIAVFACLMIMALCITGFNSRLNKLEHPKKDEPRACLDYTMREIRAGDSPEKCGPELFADSVTE